ncbi:hypothetical protein HF086_000045 [Spodoptera exigua]|uniref:Uncharacterized protein n=1 Tax=Spodoptera exigua TaxID=7107 RepID=A0A922N090_SPOEX|nr:hypothetical protein HF086_000045 [Spodoptera exigua]
MDISLNNEKIELVRDVKFLGIHLDDLLNWKKELAHIDSTISSACFALRTLRDETNKDQLKMVYYALVESRLRYSIQFWGKSYGYNFQRAFILQKRAVRTIVRISQRESCRPHFQRLGILTLPSLYILVLLVNFKKYVYEFESENERIARESTRRKDFNNKIVPNLNVAKHSPQYQVVKLFNKLPADLKDSLYTSSFKAKLKEFLLARNLYTFDEL